MALLEILKYPDKRLRTKAELVTTIDDQFRQTVADMYQTMYAVRGVGLAATQVNIHLRFFVMDVSEKNDQPLCVINPEIIHTEGIQYEAEGCLSVNDAYDKIERAAKVHMRGIDLEQNPIEFHAEGLMAKCIQHEVDHLNGILFIDHLSKLKQERLRKKMAKWQKLNQEK